MGQAERGWAREKRLEPAAHMLGLEAGGPATPWPPTAGWAPRGSLPVLRFWGSEPWGTRITGAGVAGGLAGKRGNESQPWRNSERKTLLKLPLLLGSETGAE